MPRGVAAQGIRGRIKRRGHATQKVDESAGYTIFSQLRTKEIGVNTVTLAIYCKIIRRAPWIPGIKAQDGIQVWLYS